MQKPPTGGLNEPPPAKSELATASPPDIKRRPAQTAGAKSSEDLTSAKESIFSDYQRSPENAVNVLRRTYNEFYQDLREFYRDDLELSANQLQQLDDIEQKNKVSDRELPLQAGIEVVTEKIFGGKSYKAYLNEVMKVLGPNDFSKLQKFLDSYPKSLAGKDPYVGELFSCCVVLSGR